MNFFDIYTSNTLAGSGNQYYFGNKNETQVHTGRLFYRIFEGGKYRYSFLFTNIMDSTYSDGSVSGKNLICEEWYIEKARVAVCDHCACETMVEIADFAPLTFEGTTSKTVHPGEFFNTDAVELDVKKGQYLC